MIVHFTVTIFICPCILHDFTVNMLICLNLLMLFWTHFKWIIWQKLHLCIAGYKTIELKKKCLVLTGLIQVESHIDASHVTNTLEKPPNLNVCLQSHINCTHFADLNFTIGWIPYSISGGGIFVILCGFELLIQCVLTISWRTINGHLWLSFAVWECL